jgi:predicted ester cyclase
MLVNVKSKSKSKLTGRKPAPVPKAKAKGKVNSKAKAQPQKAIAPAPAAPRDEKSIYQGFITDVLNGGRFELAEQYLDPVVVSHNPFPGQAPGIAGFVAALQAFRIAFPDLHANATHYIAEGDKVVGRFEVRGTHQGDFMGLAPTGRSIHYEEIAIVRLAGGRIIEHWAVADALAIMQQLGSH